MQPEEHNPITTTLGNSIAFAVFLWAAFGVYTAFFRGTVPLITWRTPHNVLFGLVWLFFVLPGSLTQARTARNCFLAVAVWNHGWSLLPLAIANLIIQVFGFLLIALAWFPSSLPGPLSSIEGGVVTGLITLIAVIVVLAPCNFGLASYMLWLFREQHAEDLHSVGEEQRTTTRYPRVIMFIANLGCLINAAILVGYFVIAKETRASPSTFIIWAWTPFIGYFLLHHFLDGVQNTTRNIARIYLLRRDGLNYSHATMRHVWESLIPNAYLPLILLLQLGAVASFVCLLLLQGWATAIIAHGALNLFGGLVPINYQRHLERIQATFPQTLFHEQVITLAYCGISLADLRSLIDQAVEERRDPQKWWAKVFNALRGGRLPDSPPLPSSEFTNPSAVNIFIDWWVSNDPQVSEVAKPSTQSMWNEGHRPDECASEFPSAREYFNDAFQRRLKRLQNKSEADWVVELQSTGDAAFYFVKNEVDVGEEYGVDFNRFNYEAAVRQISDPDALNSFKHYCLSEILLSNQRRLLMWLFHDQFGKWYTPQS